MRGKLLLLSALIPLALGVQGQRMSRDKMSPYVRKAAAEARQRPHTRSHGAGEQSLTAFVSIADGQADAILRQHGCRQYAAWGDIVIASIPLSHLDSLSAEPSVRRIEASQHGGLLMDTTTAIVNALPVYAPSSAHQAYTGDGVVVGVVDAGFDLGHPNFLDLSATKCRIGAFWDQLSRDTVGSPLPVGRDYVGPEEVVQIGRSTDAPTLTHGTHTLGIAAGSGFDTRYRGVAFESDICVVGNLISNNIEYLDSADYYKYSTAIDALGFKYCFDYAEQQGKPCVVSLSEGYPPYLDEEDSLYAAVLDQLVGPGKIIVASAGNGGIEASYFEKAAGQAAGGAFVRSFKQDAAYKVQADGAIRLSAYYYNGENDSPTDTLTFETLSVPIDTILTKRLIVAEDTITFSVYRDLSRFSHHDIWQIQLKASRTLDQLQPLALVAEGAGQIEVYGSTTSAFKQSDADGRWAAAQTGHDIYAPGCFPAVICVGATTHRLRIASPQGELVSDGPIGREAGIISPYSSTGPSMNGLLKPDVVAPGSNVVSSFSRFYQPENLTVAYSAVGEERYPWGVQTGTSMSAPVVAGIIALWLQAKPDLTPHDVKEVLSRSCRQPEDGLDYPNNTYGYGEIDAHRGLLEVLGLTAVEGLSLQRATGVQVVPCGGGLKLLFDHAQEGAATIRVYNLAGACVYNERQQISGTTHTVPLPGIGTGIYAVQLTAAGGGVVSGSQLVNLRP